MKSFVNTGSKGWKTFTETKTSHIPSKCHDNVAKEASGIIINFDKQNNTNPHQTNDTLKEGEKNYRR